MGHKIVISDESRFMRMIIRDTLKTSGFQVLGEAENGSQAFDMCCTYRPDLLTVDPFMRDTERLIPELRRKEPGVRVLLIAPKGMTGRYEALAKESEAGLIAKPFHPLDLLKAVNTLLGAEKSAAPPAPPSQLAEEFQGYRVLVVDDEEDIVRVLAKFLARHGFEASMASNGREALEVLGREKPHLIVTDIMMPELDGLNLIRRVRQDPATSAIPIMILSQKSEIEDKVRGFELGTDDYLSKPFSPIEMLFRIKAVLKRAYSK
jgi:DNA-binding response OmpR family regulator